MVRIGLRTSGSYRGWVIAVVASALLAALPRGATDAQSITVTVGDPGDHWAEMLGYTYIGRDKRDGTPGYTVQLLAADGCEVELFWPRRLIDFRGRSPTYRMRKVRVATGWLWYPTRLTAASMPVVYEGVQYIEAHYARQADGAIAIAKGFALVAGVGMLVSGPRTPSGPRAASGGRGAAAGAAGRGGAGARAGAGAAGRAGTSAVAGTGASGRGFKSFPAFKRVMGRAGPGKHWHHIVEQGGPNVARFGATRVHNTANVIRLEASLHRDVSALYSSIRWRITGSRTLTVRQWVRKMSFEEQHAFGLRAIAYVKAGLW